MEIKYVNPRRGEGTLRIGDSDDLVVTENIVAMPDGKVCMPHHCTVFICTEGRAQFEYDGAKMQVQQNDLFLCMRGSIVCNFMASSNFNCRQIWFNQGELWNINIYSDTSLSDLARLKQNPMVHLSDDDVALLDNYFQLLCHRMRCGAAAHIVRSLVSTMFLEMLVIMRRDARQSLAHASAGEPLPGFHRRRLVDQFMQLVEQSDGRLRRVDELASQLNITPKYLSTILKETMNRRPSAIIQLFTMKAIERRLRFTDMTMQAIAIDLNFPNASFFGKYFKERAGMTPLEYRLKYHKGR
ncbi:MAG: helix-turn-helix transcriptional regulator [Prevotella sp.]|nr:helix-turn-helix transcriptional regulator [Prevotella sp.]